MGKLCCCRFLHMSESSPVAGRKKNTCGSQSRRAWVIEAMHVAELIRLPFLPLPPLSMRLCLRRSRRGSHVFSGLGVGPDCNGLGLSSVGNMTASTGNLTMSSTSGGHHSGGTGPASNGFMTSSYNGSHGQLSSPPSSFIAPSFGGGSQLASPPKTLVPAANGYLASPPNSFLTSSNGNLASPPGSLTATLRERFAWGGRGEATNSFNGERGSCGEEDPFFFRLQHARVVLDGAYLLGTSSAMSDLAVCRRSCCTLSFRGTRACDDDDRASSPSAPSPPRGITPRCVVVSASPVVLRSPPCMYVWRLFRRVRRRRCTPCVRHGRATARGRRLSEAGGAHRSPSGRGRGRVEVSRSPSPRSSLSFPACYTPPSSETPPTIVFSFLCLRLCLPACLGVCCSRPHRTITCHAIPSMP